MMSPDEGRERGEKRAKRGIKRAAFKHGPEICRDTLRFLDALLASPTGCATTDDATADLLAKHADGGNWRSNVPKRLKAAGLIVFVRVVKSARPARHGGYVTEWRLVNRAAAEEFRAVLATEIEKDAGESAGTDSPAVNSSTNPPFTGEANDGKAV